MTDYNLTVGTLPGQPNRQITEQPYMVTAAVDFSTTTNASGDRFNLILVPAGTMVVAAGVEIITGGTGSGTLRPAIDTTYFSAAYATTVAGYDTGSRTSTNTVVGANNTLDLLVGTDAVNCVARLWALFAPLNVNQPLGPQSAFA